MLNTLLHHRPATHRAHLLHFLKGESIYFEGDCARAWFAVAEGVARTCRFQANGHRQLTGFYLAGDAFGLEDNRRLDTAEAVTALSLWYYPHQEDGSDREGDEDARRVEMALRTALDNANRCVALFGHRTAPERIAAFLLMIAGRIGSRDLIELPMSRSDVADYLGLTIHTVSRTLSQLCRDRIIALEGSQHCRIIDLNGLCDLAGDETPRSAGGMG